MNHAVEGDGDSWDYTKGEWVCVRTGGLHGD